MEKLTKEDARKIALSYLLDMTEDSDEPLVLLDERTREKEFGWVFFYNSKEYIETGNLSSMLAGNAPFIVNKSNGELFVTGTAKPIEDYIAEYEQQYNQS